MPAHAWSYIGCICTYIHSWEFPKIRGTFGVLIIRSHYLGYHIRVLYFRKLPYGEGSNARIHGAAVAIAPAAKDAADVTAAFHYYRGP